MHFLFREEDISAFGTGHITADEEEAAAEAQKGLILA